MGCRFWAGLAGSVWRRATARIPKGAGQNGSMFRLCLGVGIGWLPGQWRPAKVSARGATLAAGWGQTKLRRGTEGLRFGGSLSEVSRIRAGGLCQDGAGLEVRD